MQREVWSKEVSGKPAVSAEMPTCWKSNKSFVNNPNAAAGTRAHFSLSTETNQVGKKEQTFRSSYRLRHRISSKQMTWAGLRGLRPKLAHPEMSCYIQF